MFRNNNLKDSNPDNPDMTVKDNSTSISYNKTGKLITALYMVTDIVDRDEPLRHKLRTLGAGIISDVHTAPADALVKISQILSFLDLASAMSIISDMNCAILRKEFLELNRSLQTASGDTGASLRTSRPVNLAGFFRDELSAPSNGHSNHIGVQKGSTLMKALKGMSDKNLSDTNNQNGHASAPHHDFNALKKERREDIINMIKLAGGNATIKDIKDKAQAMPERGGSLAHSSDKTLQRELVAMVKDGVLNKTGEKRWSRYFLK